jgi:hypothetical protein
MQYFTLLATLLLFFCSCKNNTEKPVLNASLVTKNRAFFSYTKAYTKCKNNAAQLKQYALKNNYNTTYCVLIDMRLPSHKNRFFVYNLQKDTILYSGLVAHGTGSQTTTPNADLSFSNVDGSRCTSLGKYKIGKNYMGAYGYSYKLYGLDTTNSNAFKRAIVMHSHNCVPTTASPYETDYSICYSWGCPMITPTLLNTLKPIINKASKPLLMWIYY